MSNELQKLQVTNITDMQAIGKLFAESGMFENVKTMAQAVIRIMAGQEIGLPPFASISGIHLIKGKPTIGSGLIAARIKGSGKYDYKVIQMDDKACSIDFYQGKEKIGNSIFTIADAQKAGTQNIEKFPRNMLFARAISNGVKWFCPDVFAGPVYVPEEMDNIIEDTTAQITTAQQPSGNTATVKELRAITVSSLNKAIALIQKGELDTINKAKQNYLVTDDQIIGMAKHAAEFAKPLLKDNPEMLTALRSFTLNDGRTTPYTEAEMQELEQLALPY